MAKTGPKCFVTPTYRSSTWNSAQKLLRIRGEVGVVASQMSEDHQVAKKYLHAAIDFMDRTIELLTKEKEHG